MCVVSEVRRVYLVVRDIVCARYKTANLKRELVRVKCFNLRLTYPNYGLKGCGITLSLNVETREKEETPKHLSLAGSKQFYRVR